MKVWHSWAAAMLLPWTALCVSGHAQERKASSPVAERFATCHGFLEGAAFDREGNLWVVDLQGGAIYSIDLQGQCVRRGSTGGAPNGARFHPDGRLFIADNKLGIVALDTKTMHMTVIANSYAGKPIRSANDLAFDSKGGVYFTDPNGSTATIRTGRVFHVGPDGGRVELVADGLSFPNGITLSPDGNEIRVGQLTDKSILSIPAIDSSAPVKASYVHVRTDGGMGPDGMTTGADGTLYWAQFNGGGVGRADVDGYLRAPIRFGSNAGKMVTNVAIRDGWLYATEASKGEVWRVRID